jgi:hypothetical protein
MISVGSSKDARYEKVGWKSVAPSTFEEYEPALLGTHGGRRSAFPPYLYREEIR